VQLAAGAIEQSRRQAAGGEINAQIPARIPAFWGWGDRICCRMSSGFLLLCPGKLAKIGFPLNNSCFTLYRN
jgi:hypothetical protein